MMIPIVGRLDGIPGSGDPVEDSNLRSLPRSVRPVKLTIQDHLTLTRALSINIARLSFMS